MGIGETLQTKAGPLPVWAWGVGGGVALALVFRLKGAGGANPAGPIMLQPGSVGGGLSVNQPAQGTGTALAPVAQPAPNSPDAQWFTGPTPNTPAGNLLTRHFNEDLPRFSMFNNWGSGWLSAADANANRPPVSQSMQPTPVVMSLTPHAVPSATYNAPAPFALPTYNDALDRLRSFVGWSASSRVDQWVSDAENIAKSRGLWGVGGVTDANLRAIALGGIKWQQEDHNLSDPFASGFDLSGFVGNTLNPGDAVTFLHNGGRPNSYALDYSRTSESGRPLTALQPVGV